MSDEYNMCGDDDPVLGKYKISEPPKDLIINLDIFMPSLAGHKPPENIIVKLNGHEYKFTNENIEKFLKYLQESD